MKNGDTRQRFIDRLRKLFKETGKTFFSLQVEVGIDKSTIYRGVKTKSTLAAIAYHLGMKVEDMVEGTDAEDIWYR